MDWGETVKDLVCKRKELELYPGNRKPNEVFKLGNK